MDHRYEIFAAAVRSKSFTRAAKELGYTQSAVSQAVRSLEAELGTVLITRSHDGITLTRDGEIFFPYFESILAGERALHVRMKEMHGLTGSLIRIGTFSSISQNLLPPLISSFLVSYPETRFELLQGEYTSIAAGIKSGDLDFGFVSPEFVSGLQTETIYTDTMMAVLPLSSPLAVLSSVSLSQLASLPCILLDEGRYSVALKAFEAHNLTPDIRFKVG